MNTNKLKAFNPRDVAVNKYDITMLDSPFMHNGREINAVIRIAPVIIRNRIEASSWSTLNFGKEISDAVLSYCASAVLRFGVLKGEFICSQDGSMNIDVVDPEQIAPDILIDNVIYGDFINLAYLLGKTQRSCASKGENSVKSHD